MNEYLLSLLMALQAEVTGLASALSNVQIALAKVMGFMCGEAFSDAVNSTEVTEVRQLPPPSDVKFKRKEFAKMTESVRIAVQGGHIKAHMRLRKDGLYEVRAQCDKKVYTGAGKTEEEAIDKFIECINRQSVRFDKYVAHEATNTTPPTPNFKEYTQTWLDVVKRPNIKLKTYDYYVAQFKRYVYPKFGEMQIGQVTALRLQEFINGICDAGSRCTANQLYMLLHALFDYAVADGVIASSPMRKLRPPTFEQHEASPLTREQEKSLVERFENSPDDKYLQAYVFILYTGLRRSEVASAVVEDGFVKVVCAKTRANRKEKTRFIPITPMLAKYLSKIDMEKITAISKITLSVYAGEYLDGHCVHELRHTFITRCRECGVRREIVSLWAGHKLETSSMTDLYTHLEQNLAMHKEEAEKVAYEL